MSTIEGESTEHGSAGDEDHDSPSRSHSARSERNDTGSTGASEDAELSAPVDTTESNPAKPLSDKVPERGVSSSTDNTDGGEVSVLERGEEPEDSQPSSPVTVIESGSLEHDSGEDSGTGSSTVEATNHGLAEDVYLEEPGNDKPLPPLDDTERDAKDDSHDSAESSLSSSPEDSPPKAEISVQVAGRRDPVTQEDMDRAIKNAENNKDNEDKTHLRYPENDHMIPGKPISPHRPRCVRPDQSLIGLPPPFVLNSPGKGPDKQALEEAVDANLPTSAADAFPESENEDYPNNDSEDHGRPQTPSGPVDDTNIDDPFSDFTSVTTAENGLHDDTDADSYVRPVSRGSVRSLSHFSSSSEEEDEEDDEEHAGQDDEERNEQEQEQEQDVQEEPKWEPDLETYILSQTKDKWIPSSELKNDYLEDMLAKLDGKDRPRKVKSPARRPSPLSAEIEILDVPDLDQESGVTEAAQHKNEASGVLNSGQESTTPETDQLEIEASGSPDTDQGFNSAEADQLEPTIPSPRGLRRRLSQRNLELARERLNGAGLPMDFLLDPANSYKYPVWAKEGELQNIFDRFRSEIMNGRDLLAGEAKKIQEMKAVFTLYAELKERKASVDQQLVDTTHKHNIEWNELLDESDMFKEKSKLLQQDVERLEMELKTAREECEKLQKQTVINSATGPAQCDNCPRLQREIDRLENELLLLKSTTKTAPEGHEDRSNKLAEDVRQLQEDLAREKAISKELKDQQTFALALSTYQDGVQWPKEKRGAVAAIIVDYINGENRDQERPLQVEEVLDVLEQNLDIQDIARWLDKHQNRYRFKPYRLFQSILFSGEVLNLGLVAAFLSIPGYMDQGQVTYTPLRDYIDLFQTLREEWTEKYSKIRETLDRADTERTALLLQLEDMEEQNKSAKADSDMAKELAKAKRDLSDKVIELEGSGDVISELSGQQEKDNAEISNLKAEKKELESKVEQLTKDLKGKNIQATKQVDAVDTTDSECEKRVKQLEDEAQRLRNTIDEFNAQANESDKLREELKALNEHVNKISAQAAEASRLREDVDKLQKQNANLNAKAQMDAKLIQELKEAKDQPKVQQGSSNSGSDDPADKECPKKLARLTQEFEDARKDHKKQVRDLHEELDHEKQKANKKIELAEKWRIQKVDLETQITDLEAKISELEDKRSENASSTEYASADGLPAKHLEEVQLDLSEAHARIRDLEAQIKTLEQQGYQSEVGRSDDMSKQIRKCQQQISALQAIKDEHLQCPIIIAGLQDQISPLEAIEAEHRRCSARTSHLEENIQDIYNAAPPPARALQKIAELESKLASSSGETVALLQMVNIATADKKALKEQVDDLKARNQTLRSNAHAAAATAAAPANIAGALQKIAELESKLASSSGEKDALLQMVNIATADKKALKEQVDDLEATNQNLRSSNTATTPVAPANIASALQEIAKLKRSLSNASSEKDTLLQMVTIATAGQKAFKERADELEATNRKLQTNNTATATAAPASLASALQKIAELESNLLNASREKDSLLQMVKSATAGQKAFKERADELEATNRELESTKTITTDQNTRHPDIQKLKDDHKSEMQRVLDLHNEEIQRLIDERGPNDQSDVDQDSFRTIKNLKSQNGRLADENQGLHTDNARLEDEKKKLNTDNARLEDDNKRLNTKLATSSTSVKPDGNVADLETQIKNQTREIARLGRSAKEMRGEIKASGVGPSNELIALRDQVASLTLSFTDAEQRASQVGRLNAQIRDLTAENRNLQSQRNDDHAPTSTLPESGLRLELRQDIARLRGQLTSETSLSRQLQARVTEVETENKALEEWSGVAAIQNGHKPEPSSPPPEVFLRLDLSRRNVRLQKQVEDLKAENKALKDRSVAARDTSKEKPVNPLIPFFDYPIDTDIGPHADNIRARVAELEAASNEFKKQLDRDASGEPHVINEFRNYRYRMQIGKQKSHIAALTALLRSALGCAEGDRDDPLTAALESMGEGKGNAKTEGSGEAKSSDGTESSGEAKGSDETEGSGEAKSSDGTEGSGETKGSDESEGSGEAKSSDETEGSGQSEGSGETDSSESKLAKENAFLKDRIVYLDAWTDTCLKEIGITYTESIPVLSDESEDNLARATVDVYRKQADEGKAYYSMIEERWQRERRNFAILQRDMLQLEDTHEQEWAQANATMAGLRAKIKAASGTQASGTDGTSKPKGTTKGKETAKDAPKTEGPSDEEQPDTCEKKLASAKGTIAILRFDLKVTETRIQSLGRERENLLRLGGDEVKNALANAKGGLASSLAPARRASTKTDNIPEDEQPGTCEEKLALARSIAKNLRVQLRAAQSQIQLFERGNANLLRIGGDSLKNALAAETGQPPKFDDKKGKEKAKITSKTEGTPEGKETDTCERKLAFAQATITDLRAQLKDAQTRADGKTPKTLQSSGEINGGVDGVPNGGINGGPNGSHTDSDADQMQDQLIRANWTIRTLQKEMVATGDPEKSHISTYLAMANQARDELHGAHYQIQQERATIAGMHYDRSQLQMRHEKALADVNARTEQLERENAKLRRIGGQRVKTAVGAAVGTAVATGAAALSSAFGRPRSPRPTTTTGRPPTRIPVPAVNPRPANTTSSPASTSGSISGSTSGPTSSPTGTSGPADLSKRPTRPLLTPRPTGTGTTQSYLPLDHRIQIRPINRNNPARLQALAEHDRKAAEMRQRHADEADRQQRIDDYLQETWGVGRWRSRKDVWWHVFMDGRRGSGSSQGS